MSLWSYIYQGRRIRMPFNSMLAWLTSGLIDMACRPLCILLPCKGWGWTEGCGQFIPKLIAPRDSPKVLNSISNSLLRPRKPPTSFLCINVKSFQSPLIFCSPMDCSTPGSLVHGIFQERILEWAAVLSSRRISGPREPGSPVLQADSLPSEPPGKPYTSPAEHS